MGYEAKQFYLLLRTGLFFNHVAWLSALAFLVTAAVYWVTAKPLWAERQQRTARVTLILLVVALGYRFMVGDALWPSGALETSTLAAASIVGAYLASRRRWGGLYAPGLFCALATLVVSTRPYLLEDRLLDDANPLWQRALRGQGTWFDAMAAWLSSVGFGYAVVAGAVGLTAIVLLGPMSPAHAARLALRAEDRGAILHRGLLAASRGFPLLLAAVVASQFARIERGLSPEFADPSDWLIVCACSVTGAALLLRTAEGMPLVILATLGLAAPLALIWPDGVPSGPAGLSLQSAEQARMFANLGVAVYLAAFCVSAYHFVRSRPWSRLQGGEPTIEGLRAAPDAIGVELSNGALRVVAGLRQLGYRQDDSLLVRGGEAVTQASGVARRGVPAFVYGAMFLMALPAFLIVAGVLASQYEATVHEVTVVAGQAAGSRIDPRRSYDLLGSTTSRDEVMTLAVPEGESLGSWLVGFTGDYEAASRYVGVRELSRFVVTVRESVEGREHARVELTSGRRERVDAAVLMPVALRVDETGEAGAPAAGAGSGGDDARALLMRVYRGGAEPVMLLVAIALLVAVFGRFFGRGHEIRWAYAHGELYFEITGAGPWVDRRVIAEYLLTAVTEIRAS